MIRRLALFICIALLGAPLGAQSSTEQQLAILDSLKAESCRGGTWQETAKGQVCRGSTLGPRKEEIRRWAERLRVLVLEGLPVPETPEPAPAATIAITPNADTLRQRPASPHNVFVLIRVDSAGETVGDSAELTASGGDAAAKVWWNAQARRYEVYDASKAGTLVLTAVRGSAASSITLPVSAASTPPAPPTTPPDTSTPTPPTPPTNPTPPASAAAALAKIGPTISPAAAAALGGGYAQYDVLWAKWEPTRWNAEGKDWSSNYYDRAQIYYAQWIRTGNATYKQRGDAIALDYRRGYLHASNYQTSAHWAQLDGVALHYWLNGDDSSLVALGKAAWNLAGTAVWPRTGPYVDARGHARALTAMLLAWQANAPNAPSGGWAKALDAGIDNILTQQSADGAWRFPVNTCDLSLNYMGAMLADALIRVYESYRPDPRIPQVVKKTADFLWTQWRPNDAVPSFNYYEAQCNNQHGNGGPNGTPDLTGLFVSTYAWMAKQDAAYRPKSDAVFAATMKGMYPQGSKQFNQAFAYGWRALGYLP